jgi:pimeloyl-ACP methyl ester carboxylesterase
MARAKVTAPRWVALGDGRCAVSAVGDAEGPRTVLLPGLSDGLAPISDPAARALLGDAPPGAGELDGRLISYRDPLVPPVTTATLARDVATVIDRTGHGPALLLCHSMGAMVAQHLAADRPDLVSGLVLSATLPYADAAFRAVVARWESLVVAGDPLAFAEDAVASSFVGAERERRLAAARRDPPEAPPPERVARHVALTAAAASHDARHRLAAIGCPTLVVAGERDEVCPPHHAEALATAIGDARMVVLDGLGHGFPEQGRDRFAAAVAGFVAELAEPVAGTG